MNNIIYLDTSGLNFLADSVSDFDLFRFWKETLKIEFCISAVVLWEVLLSTNDRRRDELIYWAQFNCAEYLLKSPSELFVRYLENRCPQKDKKQFWYDRKSELDIGETWVDIHGDIEKNLIIDLASLQERTQPVREVSKNLKTIIGNMCDKEYPKYADDPFHDAMLRTLNSLKWNTEISSDKEKTIKLSMIFVFFFICVGLELDNSPIRNYWNKIGIDEPFDRLDWLIENMPEIVIRGPVIEMVKMAEAQFISANSTSRGLIHDCLHSVYCYYADNIVTGDDHFKNLSETFEHQTFRGIIMVDDFKIFWEKTTEELIRQANRGR